MLSLPPTRLKALLLAAVCGAAALAVRADPGSPGEPTSGWDISDLLDRLPDLRKLDMPKFPDERFLLYVRPHFGDLLRRDYLRLPVGVRMKASEHLEFTTELESYFTHGFGDAAGYGLSRLRVGAKQEQTLDADHPIGWSVGVDYYTPLSRPPRELTDGFRHTIPYVSFTRRLVPEWKLVGYVGFGADLIDHSAIDPNYGRNQLHGNSVGVVAGVTRPWKYFRTALTTTWSTTRLITDEDHDVYAIRPDVLIPLNRRSGVHTRLLLAVGARSVWGPDGHETGLSSSLRIEFSTHVGAKE